MNEQMREANRKKTFYSPFDTKEKKIPLNPTLSIIQHNSHNYSPLQDTDISHVPYVHTSTTARQRYHHKRKGIIIRAAPAVLTPDEMALEELGAEELPVGALVMAVVIVNGN